MRSLGGEDDRFATTGIKPNGKADRPPHPDLTHMHITFVLHISCNQISQSLILTFHAKGLVKNITRPTFYDI